MSLKNNILSRTVTFLKENHLDIKDLNEEMVKNVMSSDNLSEQVDPAEYGIIDGEKREKEIEFDVEVRGEPLTKKELTAVNLLHKNFTKPELENLSSETPGNYSLGEKFWDVMKLLGYHYTYGGGDAHPKNTRVAHYAKLAADNYTEEGNYEDITNPIRTPLSWWNVELDQTGSQVEMKTGDVTLMGYDEEDAESRAMSEFDSWEGEWETQDWGDYEEYDTEVRSIEKLDADPMTVNEQVEGYAEEDEVDRTPFTSMEVKILKQLHRNLNKDELQQISEETPETYKGGSGEKFWNVMKLFGINFSNDIAIDTRVSKYAKWAFDNWTEEGDYENIEAPIKTPLKWYQVERSETGSQVEYKDGTAEVLGFDEDDAGERADYDFYSWGGEMETTDWGDYETYDSKIEDTQFIRLDETIRRILREQEEGPDLRTKALISIGGIQRDKVTTPKFIKNIFKSSGHQAKSSGVEPEDGGEWNRFYTPGTNIDLNADLQRIRDRIRFEEYGEMFQQGIEGRGFAFEGMLAGLFNGEPMEAGGKEDIKVGNDYYSIKQSNPGDAWDTGSLQKGYQFARENMVRDGFAEEEIPPTPVELMIAGQDYIQYQAQMLTESFKASNGQPLKWIFAHVLDDKHIKYVSMDSDELISTILSSDCSNGTESRACAVGKSRKKDTGIRIKSRFVLGADPKMITFPEVSEEDIRSIIYDPEGDRIEDKIRRIFKNPNKVSQYTVEYIRDNPKEFVDAVNREIPNLTLEERNIAYNLLLEETDVFGQGLLDPIAPEEFEGTQEEWEKIVKDTEEEGDKFDYDYDEDETLIYTGGPTDPERGFVAPSKEVTTNVCRVEGFCQEQGPITFGQLKALVEAATRKRIQADMGRGVFKMLWRIIPFFVPQILLAAVGVTATRAFNKIITPALTDTRGYKEWWGKAVLKAMDIAEGDYIPDITMGDDPLSKVFFISDGLMSMIKDKYKLKFARYVADYAATRPDNEPVPEWFVENLLRDYLNQKFLLNPPLPVKIDIETKKLDESYPPLKPEEQKKIALTTQVFNTLDDEFSLHPHPEGDIESVEEPVALYSQSLDMFVPMDYIFTPINNMVDGGIPKEDIEMFVDIITDWLNQRINLKTTHHLNEESHNPFGLLKNDWKDELLRHEKNLSANELKHKKLADQLNGMTVTIPVDIHDGAEPVIGTTDITFTIVRPFIFQGLRGDFFDNMRPSEDYKDNPKRPTVIKYDLVFRGVEPGSILEELLDENSLEGMDIHNISARERLIELLVEESYNINESLMKNYFKLYGATIGRVGKIYDSQQLEEQSTKFRDNWQEDKKFTEKPADDSKLNVSPESLWKYLNSNHRERLIKAITPTLDCLIYNCYDGWKNDPDNEWDEDEVDFDEMAQGYCSECGDELNAELEKVDQDLVKLGFAQEHDSEGYDDNHRKTWLEKPFPHSYNVWVDGVVKEINPRFYVDVNDDISYWEDRLITQPKLFEHKESQLSPKLQIGDEIIVVDVGTKEINPENKPDMFLRYFVTKIYSGDEFHRPPFSERTYYGLNRPDVDVTDPERPGVYDQSSTHKYLFPHYDTWIFNPKGKTMKYEDAFQPDHYLSDEEYEELYGDDGQDEYGGYPDLIPETKKEKIREHTESRLNPELEEGDTILVVNRKETPVGYRDPLPGHTPELFTTYVVIEKRYSGHKAKDPYHYFLLPEDKYDIFINDPYAREVDDHERSLFPWIHDWILDKEDIITEQKDSKLNPELMVGDEIVVVSTEGIHDFGSPNLFKPYVVVGIKHGTTMNREKDKWTHDEDEEQTPERNRLGFRKGFDTIPYTYYQIEPIGMTDEERTGAMLAGGGRMKPMYIFPSPSEYRGKDQWILRPGFRRGEHLTEDKMDEVPLSQIIGDNVNNEEFMEILNRFPEKLQRELLDERPKPEDFIEEFKSYHLNSPEPIEIYLEDELNKDHTIDTMSRTPEDVVDTINDEWDTDYESIEVYDPNPDRYFEYANFPGSTAKPSLMVNGEIAFGVARFVAALLRGDEKLRVWDITKKENLTEHIHPGINPELEIGDIIKIIDIDREVENNTIKYHIPPPELRPEKFTPYAVVDKESNGSESKYPFRYTLVAEDELEGYERYPVLQSNPLFQKYTTKLLFPWVHQWIYADTPMANKVDRLTISEHKDSEVNPDLEEGDIIRVIDIDGEHANMPDRFGMYKVYGVMGLGGSQEPYYQLSGETSEVIHDRLMNGKYLYRGDTWIYAKTPIATKVDRKTISEHTQPRLNPELKVGDHILVVHSNETVNAPELYVPYVVEDIRQSNMTQEIYYNLDMLYPPTKEDMLGHDIRRKDLRLAPNQGDAWIFVPPDYVDMMHESTVDDRERIIEALNDLVYRDEPREKHTRRMQKDLGDLRGFPLDKYRNMPPPANESSETEEEIGYLEGIPVDKTLVDSADEIREHFTEFLSSKGLEYPIEELKQVMPGVKAIILRLKYYYNRPRPWQIAQAKGLPLNSETLQSSSSPSYPSGHATQGRFVARYLADLYPEYEEEIRKIGEEIAYSRNMAKVHYPSDSKFGKLLGDDMYEYVYKPQTEELETELDEYCPMGNPNRCEIVDYDRLPDTIHEGVSIDDSSHPYKEEQYIDFIEYAVDQLDIEEPPFIKIEREPTSNYTTGSYNKKTGEIKVKGVRRQLADLLRSIAHEMVHHRQNELGLIIGKIPAVGGKIEDDANLYAGRLVKSYGQQFPNIYTESTVQKVFRRTINEALEPEWSIRRGRQHYAMNRTPESGEQITAFNDYLVKKSPFIYDGFEYYLSAIPGNMPNSAKIDLFIPQIDKGEDADKIWSKDNLQLNNSHFPRQTQTYYKQYRDRIGEFANEMEEIGKLFSIESVIINRNINRPWSRIPDSYGNENIRPGKRVPRGWPREELERV